MSFSIPEPAARRSTLAKTAGALWLAAGTILILRAIGWLTLSNPLHLVYAAAAILLGLLKSRYVLSSVVRKNIKRIKELSPHKEKICIFAFQAIQSWFIVLIMIGLGIALRMSPLSRAILGCIYLLIGTALIRSGSLYLTSARHL